MPFDQPTRNALAKMVGECRRRLTDDICKQLQGTYGLQPDGTALEVEVLGHLDERHGEVARELRDWQAHLAANEVGTDTRQRAAAFERMTRETAFTALNRLAALRLCEERAHVIECVRRGMASDGFQLFERLTGGALGSRGETYRLFLDCMFDELALDLGVLFDRRDPRLLVFPDEQCLEQVLALLTAPGLSNLWQEDETIGWIYQYFNDPEERKKMRDPKQGGSAAPRNSYELAVRNQFFTPRYVVEFLTDNTLGRIWYEMTQGQTRLKEQCRYLVCRPNEIFLKPGESAPEHSKHDDLSQEDLLRQPVHIAHRPLKDPREIRLLDPACGSMHFGLYAFDLFEVIYDEAWELEERLGAEAFSRPSGMRSLHESYASEDAFLRDVPRIIIEHNIHGIDIDPRCAQIAGLSLWLRAHKSWQRLSLKSTDRPAIVRSNIVCAEPMPGEKELLREFVEREFPMEERPLFLGLLEAIFDKMQLVGDAGSLLKIEEEVRGDIADAKKLWNQGPKPRQTWLFPEAAPAEPRQMKLDLSGITDEQFWSRAEERIYAALRDYAEQAENGGGFQRRLFADDAAQGFAFIDLCRKRYDVVVMNPPFGDVGENAKGYVFANHLREKTELAACFVTRAIQLLVHAGSVGVISNRTFLFSDSFQGWRQIYLKGISVCADLGFGVLDALVETAAFVVGQSQSQVAEFVALMNSTQKAQDLLGAIRGESGTRIFLRMKDSFDAFGTEWFYYWLPEGVLAKASELAACRTGLLARPGLQTCDNFRFVRLAWEPAIHNRFAGWFRLSKGGEYQPFWADVHLVTWWEDDGKEMKAFIESSYDSWSKQIPSVGLYTLPGLTYSERTTSSLSLRVFPGGCLFDKQGPFVGYRDVEAHKAEVVRFLGFSYCYLFRAIVESHIGLRDATEAGSPARHYMPSMIERLPLPELNANEDDRTTKWVNVCIDFHRRLSAFDPTDSFHFAFQGAGGAESIAAYQQAVVRQLVELMRLVYAGLADADRRLRSSFQLETEELNRLEEFFGPSVALEAAECLSERQIEIASLLEMPEDELVARAATEHGNYSSILKQSFVANRRLELVSLCLRCTPRSLLNKITEFDWLLPTRELCLTLCDLLIGSLFGRWDIRYATGERPAPELPDPFAPLPVCPPGMLQGDDGLPLSPEAGRRLRAEGRYPLDVAWDGILVDDPEHPLDIERCVRTALSAIWADRADAIEPEACALLGVPSLREWLRRPAGFFADHLKRYSKSRRQAPIYWPLSTPSGSYALWIYYHRLTDQTLYACVNNFIQPKLNNLERDIAHLRHEKRTKDLQAAVALQTELEDLKQELLTWAPRWKPNLNDGVLITACPLWKLFRLPKWRKDLEACWKELEGEEYEWAHLAYSLWPERVRKKCKKDRSLAIAHGLEEICEVEPPKPKKARKGRGPKSDSGRQMDLGATEDAEDMGA